MKDAPPGERRRSFFVVLVKALALLFGKLGGVFGAAVSTALWAVAAVMIVRIMRARQTGRESARLKGTLLKGTGGDKPPSPER